MVRTVAPGFVRTPLISSIQAKVDQIASEIVPMKRVAEPQEVADLIVWLCSERSNYVNGALGTCTFLLASSRWTGAGEGRSVSARLPYPLLLTFEIYFTTDYLFSFFPVYS